MGKQKYPKAESADITLLLEGTYPFVTGGVSSWVYNLMTMLPEFNFAIIFLGGQEKDYDEIQYPFPPNLVHLETHFLFDDPPTIPEPVDASKKDFFAMEETHKQFKEEISCDYLALGKDVRDELFSKQGILLKDFLYSKFSWNYIVKNYSERCPETSFLDYFWSIRNMHLPIWKIANIAQQAPASPIVHSISTGYAGFLGALLQLERQISFILTEHGIYVKERKVDLLSQWVAVGNQKEQRSAQTQQYLTDLWIHFFQVLAHISYATANPIISLFSEYRKRQIQDGAAPDRTLIIPNGVPVTDVDDVVKSSPSSEKPIIALIGRVAPIKDIENFIRAMVVIIQHIPHAEAWIVGPTTEDRAYYGECKELIQVLGLTQHIKFLGVQNAAEIYPKIDLLVLSSISEGLPLVLLEAFSAGIPVVATDVGGCRELIEGSTPEDKALGASGIVVEIANANALAKGVIELLHNQTRWQQAQRAGKERVIRYYSQERLINTYTEVYERALLTWQASDLNYGNS